MKSDGIWRGAAAGALGGVIGSAAMVCFNYALSAAGAGRDDRGRRTQNRRAHAEPNETDGTIPDEPASEKAVSNLVETVTGEPLSDRGKRVGGSIAHHAFGAALGAIYGAAAALFPRIAAGGGLPYGALVWLTASEAGVPLAGLSKNPAEYPLVRHASSLATHLVFGLTVERVRSWIARR
jgi:hypothetical protein